MDNEQFDRWTRALEASAGRRRALGGLAGLVIGGGMLAVSQGETRAASKKHARKRCKAQAPGKTCAGQCGVIANNCHKLVDCGPCVPACLPNGAMFPPGQDEQCCDGRVGEFCAKNCLADSDCLANQTCFDFGPTKLCMTM